MQEVHSPSVNTHNGGADHYLNSYSNNYDHLQTKQLKRNLWRPLGLNEDGKPNLYFEIMEPFMADDKVPKDEQVSRQVSNPNGSAGDWVDDAMVAASCLDRDADAESIHRAASNGTAESTLARAPCSVSESTTRPSLWNPI